MIKLKNKVAIVTGATSGIGKAIALELLEQGCKVILIGRNSDKIKETILNQEKYSQLATFIAADFQNDESLKHLVNEVNKTNSRIDILIHSAGIIYLGDTAKTSIEKFDEQYKVNVRAPYFLTQAFLQNIIDHKGQMVFINSTAGLDSWANVGQYAASKHALRAWVNSLRAELLGKGVKIINIFPGATNSPMQEYVQFIEENDYNPDQFLDAQHLADIIVNTLKLNDTAVISDIVVKPCKYIPNRIK